MYSRNPTGEQPPLKIEDILSRLSRTDPDDHETDLISSYVKSVIRVAGSRGGALFLKSSTGRMESAFSEALDPELKESLDGYFANPDLDKILALGRPCFPLNESPEIRANPGIAALDERNHITALIPFLHQGETMACLVLVSPSKSPLKEAVCQAVRAIAPLGENLLSGFILTEDGPGDGAGYQTLVETMPEGLGVYNPEGEFTYANQSLCRMLGYPLEEIIGRRAAEFMSPGSGPVFPDQVSARPGSDPEEIKITWIRRDGTPFPSLNRLRPVLARNGSLDGYCSVTAATTTVQTPRGATAESDAQFKRAFDDAALGMALVDPEGIYLEVNQAFCSMLGYSAAELKGMNQDEVILKDDEADPPHSQVRTPASGEERTGQAGTKFRRKDGAVVWAIRAGSSWRDAEGNPLCHINQYINISEQHLIAQALTASYDKYRMIYQGLPFPSVTWIKKGDTFRVLDFNLAMAKLFPRGSPPSKNDSVERVFRNRPDIIRDLKLCVSERSFFQRESTLDFGDTGKVRSVHLTYIYIPPNKVLMFSKDESVSREAEKALEESEEHLRSLMESAKGFVVYRLKINPDSPIRRSVVFVSPSIKEITGVRDPMDMNSWYDSIVPEDQGIFEKARARGKDTTGIDEIFRIYHPRKGLRWLRVISRVIPGEDGRPSYANGLIADITDLKQAEQALKEKEEELKTQAASLTESNIALKVLLKNLQHDKEIFQEGIISNVKKIILTGLDSLAKTGLTLHQKAKLESIFESVDDLASPFIKRLSAEYIGLTRRELEVAQMVRSGLSSSRIAESLGISTNAVAIHRKNIRAKFGIKSRKVNLSVFLQNLSD